MVGSLKFDGYFSNCRLGLEVCKVKVIIRIICGLPQIYVLAKLAHLLSLSARSSGFCRFKDKVDIVSVLQSLGAKEQMPAFPYRKTVAIGGCTIQNRTKSE